MAEIAVTVVGGYLGAGKTTLLNHILRWADERVAVIVNDFGDINIDAALIESNDGGTIALSNGCICCSLVDGFGAALGVIRGLDPRPARLVIEASGVANPASVAAWAHGPGFELDATVVVADAETVQHKARDRYVGDTILMQLRAADIVVLNKTDLVDDAFLARTRAWIEGLSPGAPIVEAVDAAVDPRLIIGVAPRPVNHDEAHSDAADLFDSWTWQPSAEPVSRTMIETLMAELPDSVVRAKGLVWLDDDVDFSTVVQRVGRRLTLRRGPARGIDHPAGSRIVFIAVRGGPSPPDAATL